MIHWQFLSDDNCSKESGLVIKANKKYNSESKNRQGVKRPNLKCFHQYCGSYIEILNIL